jgi:hypothetical protein
MKGTRVATSTADNNPRIHRCWKAVQGNDP